MEKEVELTVKGPVTRRRSGALNTPDRVLRSRGETDDGSPARVSTPKRTPLRRSSVDSSVDISSNRKVRASSAQPESSPSIGRVSTRRRSSSVQPESPKKEEDNITTRRKRSSIIPDTPVDSPTTRARRSITRSSASPELSKKPEVEQVKDVKRSFRRSSNSPAKEASISEATRHRSSLIKPVHSPTGSVDSVNDKTPTNIPRRKILKNVNLSPVEEKNDEISSAVIDSVHEESDVKPEMHTPKSVQHLNVSSDKNIPNTSPKEYTVKIEAVSSPAQASNVISNDSLIKSEIVSPNNLSIQDKSESCVDSEDSGIKEMEEFSSLEDNNATKTLNASSIKLLEVTSDIYEDQNNDPNSQKILLKKQVNAKILSEVNDPKNVDLSKSPVHSSVSPTLKSPVVCLTRLSTDELELSKVNKEPLNTLSLHITESTSCISNVGDINVNKLKEVKEKTIESRSEITSITLAESSHIEPLNNETSKYKLKQSHPLTKISESEEPSLSSSEVNKILVDASEKLSSCSENVDVHDSAKTSNKIESLIVSEVQNENSEQCSEFIDSKKEEAEVTLKIKNETKLHSASEKGEGGTQSPKDKKSIVEVDDEDNNFELKLQVSSEDDSVSDSNKFSEANMKVSIIDTADHVTKGDVKTNLTSVKQIATEDKLILDVATSNRNSDDQGAIIPESQDLVETNKLEKSKLFSDDFSVKETNTLDGTVADADIDSEMCEKTEAENKKKALLNIEKENVEVPNTENQDKNVVINAKNYGMVIINEKYNPARNASKENEDTQNHNEHVSIEKKNEIIEGDRTVSNEKNKANEIKANVEKEIETGMNTESGATIYGANTKQDETVVDPEKEVEIVSAIGNQDEAINNSEKEDEISEDAKNSHAEKLVETVMNTMKPDDAEANIGKEVETVATTWKPETKKSNNETVSTTKEFGDKEANTEKQAVTEAIAEKSDNKETNIEKQDEFVANNNGDDEEANSDNQGKTVEQIKELDKKNGVSQNQTLNTIEYHDKIANNPDQKEIVTKSKNKNVTLMEELNKENKEGSNTEKKYDIPKGEGADSEDQGKTVEKSSELDVKEKNYVTQETITTTENQDETTNHLENNDTTRNSEVKIVTHIGDINEESNDIASTEKQDKLLVDNKRQSEIVRDTEEVVEDKVVDTSSDCEEIVEQNITKCVKETATIISEFPDNNDETSDNLIVDQSWGDVLDSTTFEESKVECSSDTNSKLGTSKIFPSIQTDETLNESQIITMNISDDECTASPQKDFSFNKETNDSHIARTSSTESICGSDSDKASLDFDSVSDSTQSKNDKGKSNPKLNKDTVLINISDEENSLKKENENIITHSIGSSDESVDVIELEDDDVNDQLNGNSQVVVQLDKPDDDEMLAAGDDKSSEFDLKVEKKIFSQEQASISSKLLVTQSIGKDRSKLSKEEIHTESPESSSSCDDYISGKEFIDDEAEEGEETSDEIESSEEEDKPILHIRQTAVPSKPKQALRNKKYNNFIEESFDSKTILKSEKQGTKPWVVENLQDDNSVKVKDSGDGKLSKKKDNVCKQSPKSGKTKLMMKNPAIPNVENIECTKKTLCNFQESKNIVFLSSDSGSDHLVGCGVKFKEIKSDINDEGQKIGSFIICGGNVFKVRRCSEFYANMVHAINNSNTILSGGNTCTVEKESEYIKRSKLQRTMAKRKVTCSGSKFVMSKMKSSIEISGGTDAVCCNTTFDVSPLRLEPFAVNVEVSSRMNKKSKRSSSSDSTVSSSENDSNEAMSSQQSKPNKQNFRAKGQSNYTAFIHNLGDRINAHDLQKLLFSHGITGMEEINLCLCKPYLFHLGHGFGTVVFSSENELQKGVTLCQGLKMNGESLWMRPDDSYRPSTRQYKMWLAAFLKQYHSSFEKHMKAKQSRSVRKI